MDTVTLSQLQFAVTCVYHFFFVPLTLGLSVIIAIMETFYVWSRKEIYRKMTRFWGKLFLINFAMGVVTGIVMEFQFGMNWAEYSRFVGDIFGAPLAIEALMAFFLESTFLGIWVFGWDRISKSVHLLAIWLVALGTNISALWILIANSFMQHPVGFTVENGRAVMIDFSALLTNSYVWGQFPHTILSGLSTGAFFVLGISVYHLLQKKDEELFWSSTRIAGVVGLIAILGVMGVGHAQAQKMIKYQPMKMAAAEGLWDTQSPAGLSVFSIIDEQKKESLIDIRIPNALSFLAYNQFTGEVRGINDLQSEYETKFGPGNYIPMVNVSYWTFRVMVGMGAMMFLILALALWFAFRVKKLPSIKLLSFFPLVIALPYLANTSGWLLTEIGRQPWVVYGFMKTANAASPSVTPGMVLTTLILFSLVYAVLMVADVYLLVKYAKEGPKDDEMVISTNQVYE